MVRAVCLCGLGVLFLTVSPPLREQLHDAFAKLVGAFIAYSPLSYVLGIAFVLVVFAISLKRGTRIR